MLNIIPIGTHFWTLGCKQSHVHKNGDVVSYEYTIYPIELVLVETKIGRRLIQHDFDEHYGPLARGSNDISYHLVNIKDPPATCGSWYSPLEGQLLGSNTIANVPRRAYQDRTMLKDYAKELYNAVKNKYKYLDRIVINPSI